MKTGMLFIKSNCLFLQINLLLKDLFFWTTKGSLNMYIPSRKTEKKSDLCHLQKLFIFFLNYPKF